MTSLLPAGSWCRISKAAALDTRLSSEAFRVLALLGGYADEAGRCNPAVGTIAYLLGLGRRQVQRHLRKIEELGYLLTWRQTRVNGRGGYSSNGYLLQFPPAPSLRRPVGGDNDTGTARTCGRPTNPASGHASAIENDAASGDASLDSDASWDDASGDDGHENPGERCVIRRPSDASSEGTTDASSHDALTSPLNKPKVDEPKAVRTLARYPVPNKTPEQIAFDGERRAWDAIEARASVSGGTTLVKWVIEYGDAAAQAVREAMAPLSEEAQRVLAMEIALAPLDRFAFAERLGFTWPERSAAA